MALEAEGSNPSIHPDCLILMQLLRKDFLQSRYLYTVHSRYADDSCYAGMAELADAPDLGSGISDVQVQVLLPALKKRTKESYYL